jgi:hypothetical protein
LRHRRGKATQADYWAAGSWATEQESDKRPVERVEGPLPDFRKRAAQTEREKGFCSYSFSKGIQTCEFKYQFEFKQPKVMHQHACNIKLL